MYVYPKRFNLGIVPAIIGAAAVEGAWSWYDPDLFQALWWEADQEQQVTNLSDQWWMLEDTAARTLPYDNDAYVELRSTMAQWASWKQQYHDAVLRRWIPFVGRDWDDELLVWFESFKAQAAKIADAGGREAERQMARRGYEEERLPERDRSLLEQAEDVVKKAGEEARGAAGEAGSGLFWPAIAVGASAALLLWAVSSSRKKPVSA